MNINKDPSSNISLGEADWNLPRIIVKNDRIVVVNNGILAEHNFAEEDVEGGDVPVTDLRLDEGGFNMVLEEVVDSPGEMSEIGSEDSSDGSNLFGQSNVVGDSYKSEVDKDNLYDNKRVGDISKFPGESVPVSSGSDSAPVDYVPLERKASAGEVVVDVEEARRGGRSMLEIAGFRDEEAEEKRKNKFRLSRY